MKQRNGTEKQRMAQSCNFRRETIQLIKDKKWDLIEPNECKCNYCERMDESPLSLIIFFCREITPEVLKTIERIYRSKFGYGNDFWIKVVMATRPSINKLSYFIENKLIDINYGSYYTVLGLYSIYTSIYWKMTFQYISSIEGFNINILEEYM